MPAATSDGLMPSSRPHGFVISEAPPIIGAEFGAICRTRLISKCARASPIPAGSHSSLSSLVQWYRRALPVLKLGPYGYGLSDWGIAPSDIPETFRGPHFVCQVLQQGPATRFGPEYGPELRQARNLCVYFHANALRFEASENGEVRQVNVGVLPKGRFTVRARIYILAAGGIKIKLRALLLLWRTKTRIGLGNDHDLSREVLLRAPFGILGSNIAAPTHRPICEFDGSKLANRAHNTIGLASLGALYPT